MRRGIIGRKEKKTWEKEKIGKKQNHEFTEINKVN
jgi:hypothetical protein